MKQWSIEEKLSDRCAHAPVGGWYDILQRRHLRNYVGAKTHGANEAARTKQHLLIEIGGHPIRRRIGMSDFGPHALETCTPMSFSIGTIFFQRHQNEFAH